MPQDGSGQLNFAFGVLNEWRRPTVGPYYDPATNSGFANTNRAAKEQFVPDTTKSRKRLRAVCIQVEVPVEEGAANTWVGRLFKGTEEKPKPLLGVKAMIIEMESMMKPVFGRDTKMKAFYEASRKRLYPVFIAADDKIAKDIPSPGDIVSVDFGNRDELTDPEYYGKVYDNPVGADTFVTTKSKFPRTRENPFTQPPPGKRTSPDDTRVKPPNWVNTRDMKAAHAREHCASEGESYGSNYKPCPDTVAFNSGKGGTTYQACTVNGGPSGIMAAGMAKAWDLMVKQAANEKVTITLREAFRSYEQQVNRRCRYEEGWGHPASKPGAGNARHQKGIAVDLNAKYVAGNIAKGVGPVYDWLVKPHATHPASTNAAVYGFTRDPGEAWHWNWSAAGAIIK